MAMESLRRPIKLYPQPPFSPHREQLPSDESDFPPIRIRRNVSTSIRRLLELISLRLCWTTG